MTDTPPMMRAAKNEATEERGAAAGKVDADTSPTDAANAILEAIAGVSRDVRDLGARIDDHDDELRSLRRAIHGSKRPPDGGGGTTPIADMARRGSQALFDVEELRGELLAVRSELKKQSSAMGIGKRGLDWLFSATGAKTIVRLATLAGAAYAALHAAGR